MESKKSNKWDQRNQGDWVKSKSYDASRAEFCSQVRLLGFITTRSGSDLREKKTSRSDLKKHGSGSDPRKITGPNTVSLLWSIYTAEKFNLRCILNLDVQTGSGSDQILKNENRIDLTSFQKPEPDPTKSSGSGRIRIRIPAEHKRTAVKKWQARGAAQRFSFDLINLPIFLARDSQILDVST